MYLGYDAVSCISHYIAGKDEGFTAEEEFDENDPDLMADDWHPTLDKYTPGFTQEKWLELLNRKDIIGPVWGGTRVVQGIHDGRTLSRYGRQARSVRHAGLGA